MSKGGVDDQGRLFSKQDFHSWGRHTVALNKYVHSLHARCSTALPIMYILLFKLFMFICTTLLTPPQIEITHRVAWRASVVYCNLTTISSQTLLYGGNLVCQSGCSGTVGSMSFYCTGFSTSGDWTTGGRTYTYNATGITSFEAS